jgi:nucleoside-triphosphatase
VKDVERVAVPAIERALEGSDVIVIDEVAPMELSSPKFIGAVERALQSEKPLVIAFQERSRHPLVERIRRECEVQEIAPADRESVYRDLLARLRTSLV